MKIYDCFMYFDEDVVLDVRLNILDKYVDKFVIVEATYNHTGEQRAPLFNIKKFQKFEKKIIYIILDYQPQNLEKINEKDNKKEIYKKNIISTKTLND